jgi:opacity protein-like surface antigen
VRFGGGVTVELTRHLFTTVEYRHTSYGSADIARLHVGLLTYAPKFGRTDQVAGAIGWRF